MRSGRQPEVRPQRRGVAGRRQNGKLFARRRKMACNQTACGAALPDCSAEWVGLESQRLRLAVEAWLRGPDRCGGDHQAQACGMVYQGLVSCTRSWRCKPKLKRQGVRQDPSARRQAEDADAMQRFRAQSVRLMGDAKEQGDIEFGGEVLLESKARPRSSARRCSVK